MKHLLMIAIGCTSLASLIAAAPPARSQPTKSSCPPPYYWVDVKDRPPFMIDPRIVVNGKVKVLNPPCVDSEQVKKELAKPVFYRYGEFDTYYCGGKPKTCKHIRVDPKLIKLRAPHTPSVSPTSP